MPLPERNALNMIREIKGHPPVEGYRGKEPVDIGYLEDLLVKVSEFSDKRPTIRELDLNPVFDYREEAQVVDARVILESSVDDQ